jgi:hypothetical protein
MTSWATKRLLMPSDLHAEALQYASERPGIRQRSLLFGAANRVGAVVEAGLYPVWFGSQRPPGGISERDGQFYADTPVLCQPAW